MLQPAWKGNLRRWTNGLVGRDIWASVIRCSRHDKHTSQQPSWEDTLLTGQKQHRSTVDAAAASRNDHRASKRRRRPKRKKDLGSVHHAAAIQATCVSTREQKLLSQACARPRSVLSDTDVRPAHIEETEKSLLRYFGRARSLYDVVPLPKASIALQQASCVEAQRVPLATLFPLPHSPSRQPSGNVSASPALSVAVPSTSPDPLPRPGVSSSASSAGPMAQHLPPRSAPNPFEGFELLHHLDSDRKSFCLLSQRYSSAVDFGKHYGEEEVPLAELAADVEEAWDAVSTDWENESQRWDQDAAGDIVATADQSVLFLVLYAHTQQREAVGASMQRIAAQVCELSECCPTPTVFSVIPVCVGWRPDTEIAVRKAVMRHPLTASARAETPSHHSEGNMLLYPSAGLYTMASVVQCITRLSMHARCTGATGQVVPSPSPSPLPAAKLRQRTLSPQVLLLSDCFLHIRSVVDLHGVATGSGTDEAHSPHEMFAFPSSRQVVEEARSMPPASPTHPAASVSFVRDLARCNAHPISAVISNCLSRKEEQAIARYVWFHGKRQHHRSPPFSAGGS